MDSISFEDFAKVDFRVGQITEAVEVEGSDKLIRMVVDFGSEMESKVVFSGIKKWYSAKDLINKRSVFVVNMIPKKIMGEVSEAMIFGAEDEVEDQMSILLLDKELKNGTKVF